MSLNLNGCGGCVLHRNRLKDCGELLHSASNVIRKLKAERNALVNQLDSLSQNLTEKVQFVSRDVAALRMKFVDLMESNDKTLLIVHNVLFEIQLALKRSENQTSGQSNETPTLAQSFWSASNPDGPTVPDLSKLVAKLTRENLKVESELEQSQKQIEALRVKLKASRKLCEDQELDLENMRERLDLTGASENESDQLKQRYREKKQLDNVNKEVNLQQLGSKSESKKRIIELLAGCDAQSSAKNLGSTLITGGSSTDGSFVVDLTTMDDPVA